jgi:hypothetical protein
VGRLWLCRFGVCGQNILISSHPVPWFFTVESWWLEKSLFSYGGQNKLSEVEEGVLFRIRITIKGTVSQKFYLWFFHQTSPPGSLSHVLNVFASDFEVAEALELETDSTQGYQ